MIDVGGLSEFRRERGRLPGLVGFVPTMGALHDGHKSLMDRAGKECDSVVVSIFVNPTQFGPKEDFDAYPRTLDADLALCKSAGVSLVWRPAVEDIHLPGCETVVSVSELGARFEGAARPGHFQGVATVVTKLFGAVQPHRAYFGQKDLQQLFLLRRMAYDLLMPVEIVGVPTARDKRGLALSSRNSYLNPDQRESAAEIYRALRAVKDAFRGGTRRVEELESLFREGVSRMKGSEVERFDLLDATLGRRFEEGESITGGFCSVAVRYHGVRLIDNIELCS